MSEAALVDIFLSRMSPSHTWSRIIITCTHATHLVYRTEGVPQCLFKDPPGLSVI